MSRSTETTRVLPPYGKGTAAPGTVISCVRTWVMPMSFSCCSESVALDRPTCTTGTLDAEYRMTSGGVVPGGSMRSWVWLIATTWASAVCMLACG